jgi:hypothetical protein
MILWFEKRVSTYTITSDYLSRGDLVAEGDDQSTSVHGSRLVVRHT